VKSKRKYNPKLNSKKTHARMLETVIQHLIPIGFVEFTKQGHFDAHEGEKPDRYYIRQAKWTWFYGGHSKKDAVIFDHSRLRPIVVECKSQESSGTADDKIFCIQEAFRRSTEDWILVFDGNWWNTGGKLKIEDLRTQAPILSKQYGRMFCVLTPTEFAEFVRDTWGHR
jgi:hypothetical protein